MARPIGTLGIIPTITIAGRVFTDIDNLIVLTAMAQTGTGAGSSFREPGSSSGYAVPGGQSLRILAVTVRIPVSGGSAGATNNGFGLVLLQTDNDVGMDDTTPTVTNPVYEYGDSNAATTKAVDGAYAPQTNPSEALVDFSFASGKYVSMSAYYNSGTMGIVKVYGYLE